MYFRDSKFVRTQLIEYLNRVLLQTPSWSNTGIDFIQLPGDVGDTTKRLAIAQFAFENEKYPSIVVSDSGGRESPMGFDDFIETVRSKDTLGVVGDGYLSITDAQIVVQKLPRSLITNARVLQGVQLDVMATGLQGTIYAGIGYTNNGSTITYVATGSVTPEDVLSGWQNIYIPFEATASIVSSGQPWVLALWSEGSEYYVMTDSSSGIGFVGTSVDPTIVPTWDTKDVVCQLYGTQFNRFGGMEEMNISFKVQSMNDSQVADDLAALTYRYLKLARHMDVNVDEEDSLFAIDKTGVVASAIGELHALGIYTGVITKGPEGQRPRGENDIVHFRDITCVITGEWGKEISLDELKSIDLTTLNSF